MGTARAKEEEKTDKSNSKRVVRNMEERNVDTMMGINPKQRLPSTEDLTIELSGGRESLYNRSD